MSAPSTKEEQPLVVIENAKGGIAFRMYYRAAKNYLFVEWSGYTVRKDIVAGGLAEIEWAEANAKRLGCTALINDNRQLRGSWETAVEWVRNEWSPRMRAAGFRRSAIVMSPDLFTQVSAETMAARSQVDTVEFRVFASLADAERWVAEP